MKSIHCQTYSVHVGQDSLKHIELSPYSKVAILVDENTKVHCLDKLLSDCSIAHPHIIEIASGEKHKNLSTCQRIWEFLTRHQFDRQSVLINLGGGVIGDMGGFAAASYKRGIDFIQIPTTLLAMVDASVGGKLGIDFLNYKNQIGLFKDPTHVFINPDFLTTLDRRHRLSGFAEVVKYALIDDIDFWHTLNQNDIENIDWEEIILHCVKIKNDIVSTDPTETGHRKILNFGHTIGHAIESYHLSKNHDILHGEAIAIGMLIESHLSPLSSSEKMAISSFIKTTFSSVDVPPLELLMPFLNNDKKNRANTLQFSLLNHIGHCQINCEVKQENLLNVFKTFI